MKKGIIYVRSKKADNMQTWKQMLLLLKHAKEIDFQLMGIIAVAEDDNRHNRSSIEHLHAELKKHDCCAVMVMDYQCLSEDPEELAAIKKRFIDEGVNVMDLFDDIQ